MFTDNIPAFRYITDIIKFLKEFEENINELIGLAKYQKTLLAKTLSSLANRVEKKSYNLSAKVKVSLNTENMELLKRQYSLLEELYEKLDELDFVQLFLATNFKNNEDSSKAEDYVLLLRNKISNAIKGILKYLEECVEGKIPTVFQEYVQEVESYIGKNIKPRNKSIDYYIFSLQGSIGFASYLWYYDVDTIPQFFIYLCWIVGNQDPIIKIEIGNTFQSPETLYKSSGIEITDLNSAKTAVYNLLNQESIPNTLKL